MKKKYISQKYFFYFTNHHSRASILCKKWISALHKLHEAKRFYKKNIFFILFYKSPQQRGAVYKNMDIRFLKTLWREAVYKNIFFILFYKSPQQSVDFLQKINLCFAKTPWRGSVLLKIFFDFILQIIMTERRFSTKNGWS